MIEEFEVSMWEMKIKFKQRNVAPAILKSCEHALLNEGFLRKRKLSVHYDLNDKMNVEEI